VTNECGATSNFSYFKIKPGCAACARLAKDNTNNSTENTVEIRSALMASAYPNPATNEVTIAYSLPTEDKISLSVYDALGKKVANPLVENNQAAGNQTYTLGISDFAPGIYFYTLQTNTGKVSGKFIKQ
jgi:hypothetical protein